MEVADMTALDKIIFGMADVKIELPGGKILNFDGKVASDGTSFLQAEGAEFRFEPQFADIKTADTGESNLDDRVVGYDAGVKLVLTQESADLYEAAMAGISAIKDTAATKTVGVTDAPLGASNRKRAAKVTIHPRQYGDTKDFDITLYKAASKSGLTRKYGLEQGTYELDLQAYPRDGFDMNKPGNYFFMGPVDPNAPTG